MTLNIRIVSSVGEGTDLRYTDENGEAWKEVKINGCIRLSLCFAPQTVTGVRDNYSMIELQDVSLVRYLKRIGLR